MADKETTPSQTTTPACWAPLTCGRVGRQQRAGMGSVMCPPTVGSTAHVVTAPAAAGYHPHGATVGHPTCPAPPQHPLGSRHKCSAHVDALSHVPDQLLQGSRGGRAQPQAGVGGGLRRRLRWRRQLPASQQQPACSRTRRCGLGAATLNRPPLCLLQAPPAHLEAVALVLHDVGPLAVLRRQHLQGIDHLVHLALGLLATAAHGWWALVEAAGGLPWASCGSGGRSGGRRRCRQQGAAARGTA